MNPNYHPGHGPAMHVPQSRRHQEYHQYQQQSGPQSPGQHNPYVYSYPPQYYGQPMHMPYQYPRWHPQQSYPPAYPPYQAQMSYQPYNGPRSPMTSSTTTHTPIYTQPGRHVPYSQAPQQSPSPYAVPLAQSPAISQPIASPHDTPSHSSTPQPSSRRPSSAAAASIPPPRQPFSPPLPWYSHSEGAASFPPRARRPRRIWRLTRINDSVHLPDRAFDEFDISEKEPTGQQGEEHGWQDQTNQAASSATNDSDVADHAGDVASTSEQLEHNHQPAVTSKVVKPALPALPQVAIPKPKPAGPQANGTTQGAKDTPNSEVAVSNGTTGAETEEGTDAAIPNSPSQTRAIPKSWADLVKSKSAAKDAANLSSVAQSNGVHSINGTGTRHGSIGEVLSTFDVQQDHKIAFLEPRGLVNTGNMCYMNSILQVLVFCIPFYNFLDQVGKRAAHSFKSDTPLVDAIIMFMREFKVIDSADSVEKLRLRLKDNELEQYGEPLIPEYVYGVINTLPRFSSMRRGHQQDAEEFLGFLLAVLHDECVAVMRSQDSLPTTNQSSVTSPILSPSQTTDGWLEVGPKQKAAITRQSGDPSASSPVTRIFGGALRSELRVPGLKNSVTLEPYQPLQLDIGAPNINNITDALKGLTRPESLTGDFHSPRGPGTTATKQVFIETLPPVLILHLKRFQYDSSGGTQKIWKRIGYPLELEMPKEVFAPSKRGALGVQGGAPRYRLVAVVYHHGKSAAGGHYTTDILRQDRREWIRIDDTYIRRIRAEQVAEAGTDEVPKILAKALERHQAEAEMSAQRNPYEGLDGEQDNEDDGKLWNDVNGHELKKRWAGIAATGGTATPNSAAGKSTPKKEGVKDNKVAYILLYERISL